MPSLTASPGPLAGVPTGGTGPVDAGAPRAAVAPGLSTSRPSPGLVPGTDLSGSGALLAAVVAALLGTVVRALGLGVSVDLGVGPRPHELARRPANGVTRRRRAPARRAVARATTRRVVGTVAAPLWVMVVATPQAEASVTATAVEAPVVAATPGSGERGGDGRGRASPSGPSSSPGGR